MEEHDTQQKTSLTLFVLMWVVLFALAVLFFDNLVNDKRNPNSQPVSRLDGEQVEVVLARNAQGYFVATGYVNREPVEFLLDTGATDVVLSEAAAKRAGLTRGQGGFASTANGTVVVYDTVIDRLSLGDITLRNVRASINPHMGDAHALLGMSFLRQLDLVQRGDTLTLRQP